MNRRNDFRILASILLTIVAAASGSPIRIRSSTDFLNIIDGPYESYEIEAMIDFDSIKTKWIPIDFYGKIDGNNNHIININIDNGARSISGLFRTVRGRAKSSSCSTLNDPLKKVVRICDQEQIAEIRNLKLSGTVTGGNSIGLLAGKISNSILENIQGTGKVTGINQIGGIAGEAGLFVKARNLESSVEVIGHDDVAGIFGKVSWIDFRGGISHSAIHAENRVGGVIGTLESSFVSSMLFDGNISGNDTIGGIVGISIGSNRAKTKLLTTQRLPDWFSKGLEIGMPMDYTSDYPPGGYSAFGNSECECSGLINSDTYQPPSSKYETRTELFASSMGDWLVDAVFQGKIRCRNVCGGIRGSGKSHSLALHHALSTGEVYGLKKIGGISGTGKADLRYSDMINGSVGHSCALPMFGESPTSISWGIQLLPSANASRSDCKSVYNNCKTPDTSIFSIGKMRWDGAYYPPGVLVPFIMNDEIKFKAIKPQSSWDSVSIGVPSLIDSIKNAESSGFQYWKHNSYSGSTNERYLMVDNFPPKLRKFKESFGSGCKYIGDLVESYNPNGFHVSILPDSTAWKISGNSICVNAESEIGSKAMLVIQRNNGGKSFLQLFKE